MEGLGGILLGDEIPVLIATQDDGK